MKTTNKPLSGWQDVKFNAKKTDGNWLIFNTLNDLGFGIDKFNYWDFLMCKEYEIVYGILENADNTSTMYPLIVDHEPDLEMIDEFECNVYRSIDIS